MQLWLQMGPAGPEKVLREEASPLHVLWRKIDPWTSSDHKHHVNGTHAIITIELSH